MIKLETDRLILSEITTEDIQEIHQMNCFFEVSEFNTIGIPKTIQETENVLKSVFEDYSTSERTKYEWTIRIKETKEFVGSIGMNLFSKKYQRAEIHYNLHPSFWGNGYASEAAKRVLSYGFHDLKLHRIDAGVATANVNSIKLLERIGMLREGLHRKILPIRGQWQDNYHYAILEEDFFEAE